MQTRASAGPNPGAPVADDRLVWVDMARGFCVLAVVLVHTGLFHSFPLSGDPSGRPVLKGWIMLNSAVLAELRMPMLLFVSGWLASTKVRAGLALPRTRLSILTNAYLFVVWSVLFFAAERVINRGDGLPILTDAHSVGEFFAELVYPGFGPLWFVYVLAVTSFFMALAHKVPAPIVFTVVLLVGWAVERATDDYAGLPRAVFFAAGVYAAPHVLEILGRRRVLWGALGVAVVFGVAMEIAPHSVRYLLSVIACIPMSIVFLAVIRWSSRFEAMRAPMAWIGRRTLGVYVLHWPLVGALVALGRTRPSWFGWLDDVTAAVVYPLLATVVVTGAALALEVGLRRLGLGVLFEPPAPLRRLVAGERRAPGRQV